LTDTPAIPESSGDAGRSDIEATQLPDQLREILEGELIEGGDNPQTMARLVALFEHHSGPLPDPRTIAGYKDIDGRLVDEVVDGARENRHHRYSMDKTFARTASTSLWLTWLIVVLLIVSSIAFAALGEYWPAVGFGTIGAAPVIRNLMRGGGNWTGRGDARFSTKGDDSAGSAEGAEVADGG